MRIEYGKQAAKYLNTLDRTTRWRVKDGIDSLMFGDIKPIREGEAIETRYIASVLDFQRCRLYTNSIRK
jgi:hypothetical protein